MMQHESVIDEVLHSEDDKRKRFPPHTRGFVHFSYVSRGKIVGLREDCSQWPLRAVCRKVSSSKDNRSPVQIGVLQDAYPSYSRSSSPVSWISIGLRFLKKFQMLSQQLWSNCCNPMASSSSMFSNVLQMLHFSKSVHPKHNSFHVLIELFQFVFS